MKLLIEHTALHCVERCLRGVASGPMDVENLLQICIQIIFADDIFLSSLLPKDMLARSEEILLGLPSVDGLVRISSAEDMLVAAHRVCGAASLVLEHEIDGCLSICEVNTNTFNLLPNLSPTHLAHFEVVTSALQRGDAFAIRGELSESSLYEGNDGLLCYVLSKNENLLDKVLMRTKTDGWNMDKTIRLISDIRICINEKFAEDSGSIYSPSVLRAREENKRFDIIVSKINSISKEYSHKLVGPSIETPSLSEILISQSRGDPKKLISSALDWRKTFSPLRDAIGKKGKRLSFQTGEYQVSALKELNDLAGILYKSASSGDHSDLLQAVINTKINFSIPIPSVSNIHEWIRLNRNKKKIRAFTELSREMIFAKRNVKFKENLLKSSMKSRKYRKSGHP